MLGALIKRTSPKMTMLQKEMQGISPLGLSEHFSSQPYFSVGTMALSFHPDFQLLTFLHHAEKKKRWKKYIVWHEIEFIEENL